MKYFSYLNEVQKEEIFYKHPENFDKSSSIDTLKYALGATLYMPATKNFCESFSKIKGITSIVCCLEDAISENDTKFAMQNIINCIKELSILIKNKELEVSDLPLIFIRVKKPDQIEELSNELKQDLSILSGFVFPKFSSENASEYIGQLAFAQNSSGMKLYGMPILETKEILQWDTRRTELLKIRDILFFNKDKILNLRIGSTDLLGYYGLRRSYDTTIYDIQMVKDLIGDVVNLFSRAKDGYVISGGVWEYFDRERLLKPRIREKPFKEELGIKGLLFRKEILNKYLDGLLCEVIFDKLNGIVGKTIIHPSHLLPVQSLYVVTYEEYQDALEISQNDNNSGVKSSIFGNKMNEIKPHSLWAQKILKRAKIFGVYNKDKNYVNLLNLSID